MSEALLVQFWGMVAIVVAGGTVISVLGLRQKKGKTASHAIHGITAIIKTLLAAFVAMSVAWSTMNRPTSPAGLVIAMVSYSIAA
jgi:hypothetical protein